MESIISQILSAELAANQRRHESLLQAYAEVVIRCQQLEAENAKLKADAEKSE